MSIDMTNATQAGPTHGLLDLIFGTAPKANAEGEEGQTDPLAALVKALERQGKKEEAEAGEGLKPEMDTALMWAAVEGVVPVNTAPQANQIQAVAVEATINKDLLTIAGGNREAAMLLQSLGPSAEVIAKTKSGDHSQLLKLIEQRKAELKQTLPALGQMEKAIDREGLEKVVSAGSLGQLVAKYEKEHIADQRLKKGFSTEAFLAAKGLKIEEAAGSSAAMPTDKAAGLSSNGQAAMTGALALAGASANAEGSLPTLPSDAASLNADSAAVLGAKRELFIPGLATDSGGAGTGENSQRSQLLQGAEASFKNNAKESVGTNSGSFAAIAGFTASNGLATGDPAPVSSLMDLSGLGAGDKNAPIADRVVQDVSLLAHKGGGEMKITINPRDLGEIQIHVKTDKGNVDVEVVAQNRDVASAIRNASSELADALGAQKLSLNNFDVSVKSVESPAGGGFNAQDQTQNQNKSQDLLEQNRQERSFAENFEEAGNQDSQRRGSSPLAESELPNQPFRPGPYLSNGRLDTKA